MPDAYLIIFIAISILLHLVLPIVTIIPYPQSLFGLVVALTGLLIVFATNFLLLKKKTSIQPLKKPSHLITHGPFKYSRNPIYLGMAIILFGVTIVCGSLSPLILPFLFIAIINGKFIPTEERILSNLFGQEYLNYKKKVRRWV